MISDMFHVSVLIVSLVSASAMSRRFASVLLLLSVPLLFSFVITARFTDTGDGEFYRYWSVGT